MYIWRYYKYINPRVKVNSFESRWWWDKLQGTNQAKSSVLMSSVFQVSEVDWWWPNWSTQICQIIIFHTHFLARQIMKYIFDITQAQKHFTEDFFSPHDIIIRRITGSIDEIVDRWFVVCEMWFNNNNCWLTPHTHALTMMILMSGFEWW